MYKNKGNPSDTPTERVATIGNHKWRILRRAPSANTKTMSTIAETTTSIAKKALMRLAKSCWKNSGKSTPFDSNQGTNWE